MLSERYRPKTWSDFVGQPAIEEIREACGDDWLFDSCGERWLFESDGVAGCGKTSAAYVAARALGCSDFAIERVDSRAVTLADLRTLESSMSMYGMGGNGRRCYIIDEIQHLSVSCKRFLLGMLENVPKHVIIIGTTTSMSWADEIDGLFSRWTRFQFTKPDRRKIAVLLSRIAHEQGLTIPPGFKLPAGEHNIRGLIDNLPGMLRRHARAA